MKTKTILLLLALLSCGALPVTPPRPDPIVNEIDDLADELEGYAFNYKRIALGATTADAYTYNIGTSDALFVVAAMLRNRAVGIAQRVNATYAPPATPVYIAPPRTKIMQP